MSQIIINDKKIIDGAFSFEVTIDDTVSPSVYSITGMLTSTGEYIEELSTIQNERYRLERVKVYRESFGSEENSVVYFFTAGSFGIDKTHQNIGGESS